MRRLVHVLIIVCAVTPLHAQRTQKPVLHAKHWLAITGKPLAATAGAMMFQKGGNAVDAAAAMLAATCTMWDTLSWGGETQALIYDPRTKKVIAINALGVAPSGATAEFYRSKGYRYPPEHGPLAAVTPGTPGGLLVMLAEYGKLSLKDVLEPAIQMADGYPIEAGAANAIEANKGRLVQWPYSRAVMLPHWKGSTQSASDAQRTKEGAATPAQDRAVEAPADPVREGPAPGEIFRQPDLAATLRKLVEAEQRALARGRSRREAIMAAYERFYRGDIAREIARSTQEQGGLITADDLAKWEVKIEEPATTSYKGIDVYKLREWTQGPAMLQALNILEHFDLKSMGYNSARYIHTVYQAMSLAFADRDFYYGDIYTDPVEPILGLLSKEYAASRAKLVRPDRNDPNIAPGDPYPFQHAKNPYLDLLQKWPSTAPKPAAGGGTSGTTSVVAADAEGWVVSMTPSGG
ncbi:MAG TPA: gamma-glutamyltransferase, partial [Thermoanaerobaculia bacterium]|nr:gamma-glutamyltransferase [Thermoanaerobaculia bacterium]